MHQRVLGSGLEVSAIGYGAMVLIGLYGDSDDDAALDVVRHAVDSGVTFLDTSDAYGQDGLGERLVGRAISDRRDAVQLSTTWGMPTSPDGQARRRSDTHWHNEVLVDARPERAQPALEASLRRLGVDAIDLWYLHWPDPAVPIEDSVGAMGELVEQGKARYIGVCNTSADELRRAHAAHPVAAVQREWSLWTRDIEAEVLPAARELGIGVVPWGPLGSGFLTGSVRNLGADDFRRNQPRFSRDNLQRNVDRFAPLADLAREKGISGAQLALAWLLAQGSDVVPIPGTRTPSRVDENAAATEVELTHDDLRRIEEIAPPGTAAGAALL